MKHWLFLIGLLGFAVAANAQDTIIFTQGEVLIVKILEADSGKVTYQLWNDPDQQVYTASTAEIMTISYHDGTRQDFAGPMARPAPAPRLLGVQQGFWGPQIARNGQPLSGEEIRSLYAAHPEALTLYQNGTTCLVVGNLFALPGAGMVGWELGTLLAGRTLDPLVSVAGLIAMLGGLFVEQEGERQLQESARQYNDFLQKQTNAGDEGALPKTLSGVGIAFRF